MTDTVKAKAVSVGAMQAHTRVVHNKAMQDGVCSTAAATAAKTVTLGTTFKLVNKATFIVKFANAISCENATLAVTHTTLAGTTVTEAAKPIYLKAAPLEADVIEAGASLILRYNGTQFDIIGGAGGGHKNAALVGDYDGSATYPSFDAHLDTVHTKAQTLTEAKKAQARTNIDVYSKSEVDAKTSKSFEHVYQEVDDTTGKNPSEEGWYELDGGEYVETEDSSPVQDKTYYYQTEFYRMKI